ncbi:MAG TPA: DegT/DnrJ/EryC1/StrS aminotransferase family protein [Candidatus Pacearchaeota archaeon]|nr:DegT/DnrJ/EryC1/StrS aminotransferase family protein [Candidatus Pacearchaeota archaeon]
MVREEIIRFGDIEFSEEEKKAIMDVCNSNRVTENKKTAEFERKWAEKIGTKYSIAVNSGTSGLILGLNALKYLVNNPKRNKVITTPLTFIATSNAIKISNLEPIFGDVNKETFDILPSEIERILKENDPSEFLAIVPVHLMGYPCKMDEINKLAKENNLYVFEDAAQAHGTKYLGKTIGSFGDLANYSFYIAHNIQVGEFGAVNTSNIELKNLMKKLKAHGRICICDVCKRMEGNCPEIKKRENEDDDFDPRYTHDLIGFNFKTNEFMSTLALERLKSMEYINERRRENVKYLNGGLAKHSDVLQLPIYSEEVSYLAYPLVIKEGSRKLIRENLEKKGIETRSLFGCIPFDQPSYLNYKEIYKGKIPNAEYLGKNGFFVGCHQGLKENHLDRIINSLDEIISTGNHLRK